MRNVSPIVDDDDIVNKKHSHSTADITNFPTSLPANGGNANTVNGHTVGVDVPANAKFTDTTYDVATQNTDGLMSKEDKTKLDGLSDDRSASSYYIQSGTVTVGKDANTVEITFPRAFKAVPTIVLGTTSIPTDTRYPIIATHNQASVSGFTLIVKIINSGGIAALNQSSTVDWVAFGELAEV